MLMQNPQHVKSLPPSSSNAENGFGQQTAIRDPFFGMLLRLNFILPVASFVLTTALVPAQKPGFDALCRKLPFDTTYPG